MKLRFLILLLVFSCSRSIEQEMKIGECIIDQNMEILLLLRKEGGKYLFAEYPAVEGSQVHVLDDLRAIDKVECPGNF